MPSFFIFHSYFDSSSSVTISLCYEITLPSTSLSSISFLPPEFKNILYQLWNLKSPESSYTFENPYSTGEKRARGFLSHKIVLHFFFCCPSVSWFGPTPNHPPGATAEMRCEIFNLVYPIATPQQQTPSSVELLPSDSRSSALPSRIAGSIASYEHPVLLHY